MFPEILVAGEAGADFAGERVADITDGNLVFPEKGFFEGEDAEKLVDDAPHGFDPALPPRPDLGGDQVDDGDALFFESGGDAEVEIGRVGEDGEGGFARLRGGDEFLEAAPDARQVFDDLDESDDGEIFGADDGFDAGGAHFGASAAEEVAIGPAGAEMADEFGGVMVSGGLAGGDQHGFGMVRQPTE